MFASNFPEKLTKLRSVLSLLDNQHSKMIQGFVNDHLSPGIQERTK